jgi:hypothetical protein
MEAELVALAAAGATALVQQMVTDGWGNVRDRVVALFSRGRDEEVVRGEKGKGVSVPVKYRNPSNPILTWSGRGKRPAWVNEALASGMTLEDLAAT